MSEIKSAVASVSAREALVARLEKAIPELEDNRVHGDHDPPFLTDIELLLRDAAAALREQPQEITGDTSDGYHTLEYDGHTPQVALEGQRRRQVRSG